MEKITLEMINKIIEEIGGIQNIEKNGNCMTRLRLSLRDYSLVNHSKIKQIKGVIGIIESDNQIQIILGPGKAQAAKDLVDKVLNNPDLIKHTDPNQPSLNEIAKQQKSQYKAKQTSWLQSFLAKFATIFTPLIPGFIAAGLLLGIATLLEQALINPGHITSHLMLNLVTYLKIFSKGLFLFLGILVGYNSTQAFGGSGVNGAIIASLFLLIYQSLGENQSGIPTDIFSAYAKFFSGMPDFFSHAIDPRGNIIGILIAAIVTAKVEVFIRKFIHPNLDMLLTSTLTLLVMGMITYIIIMPIGVYLFEGMSFLFQHLNSNPIGAAILAGLFLISVMFGVHQGFVPVYITLVDTQGFNSLFPILAMAGAGQVGAALALYSKAKKGSLLRQQISGAIIPGFLGIGEPLIYGVTLPRVKPFITACIGGAAGGFLIGLIAMLGLPMGLNSVFGPSGLIAIPFMTSDIGILPAILIYITGLLVAYGVGFFATYIWGSKNIDLN